MNCTNCGKEIPEINQGQFCPFCGAALAQQENAEQTPTEQTAAATSGWQPFCPWENRGTIGFVAALSQTWTESVLRPTNFFKNMPRTGGIGSPLLYAVLIGSIGWLFSLFWNYQFYDRLNQMQEFFENMPFEMNRELLLLEIPFIPIGVIVLLFLLSFVYHPCLLITGGAKNGWEVTFRVIAYSNGPWIFLFAPMCGGLVAFFWWLTLLIIGWTQAHESTTARVVVAALLPMLLCCGLILWGVMMFASMFRDLPIPEVVIEQVFSRALEVALAHCGPMVR